jgi:hypothetical protein
MTAATPAAGLRRAALELHALGESDRNWVLAALPVGERGTLETLLAELRALGIPSDAGLPASPAVAPAPAATLPPAPAPAPQPEAVPALECLDAGRVTALARVLAAEPVALTRALLAVRRWHWRDALLRELDPPRRLELAGTFDATAPAPRLQAALLQALTRRLAAEPVAPAPNAWMRLRARLAQCRGTR